jgi:hypothetical protein
MMGANELGRKPTSAPFHLASIRDPPRSIDLVGGNWDIPHHRLNSDVWDVSGRSEYPPMMGPSRSREALEANAESSSDADWILSNDVRGSKMR